MVVLLVESLPRSLDFYRRLGVEFAPGTEARRDVVVPLGDAHQLVISETFAANDPDHRPASGSGRIMLEFFVDSNAEVDARYAELIGAGYHGRRAPFETNFDAYMCMVDDPDGNTILVTAG
jgi:catechol 2,3-dioxygenase-like lactoylglutathione lyase family enzyme